MLEGAYTRDRFHAAFVEKMLPLLNPWPLPRSVVVLDNAKIHMYKELETVYLSFYMFIDFI